MTHSEPLDNGVLYGDQPALYRVLAPHFVAGFTSVGDAVIDAAPIISYARKMGRYAFFEYATQKGWTVENA